MDAEGSLLLFAEGLLRERDRCPAAFAEVFFEVFADFFEILRTTGPIRADRLGEFKEVAREKQGLTKAAEAGKFQMNKFTQLNRQQKIEMNPGVDRYLKDAKKWREEIKKLRTIALDCELSEELKWGKPCYTVDGKNIVIILGFKDYCAFLFCKGALLKDPRRILIIPGENTQAARQIRFTSVREIEGMEETLKEYLKEAVAVERAGLEVNYKKASEFKIPEELQTKLDEIPALKAAFGALTPGRQRGYLIYFSAARQSKTRTARVERCMRQILDGKGLND